MWTERLVITDVTRMREDRVCVVGLNAAGDSIRPVLPYENVRLQSLYRDKKLIIAPRHVVEFQFLRRIQKPPHVEDCAYAPERSKLIKALTQEEMKQALERSRSDSVKELFGDELIEGKYVKPGTGERSIGTVRARISVIDLTKERISFYDASGKYYPYRKVTDFVFTAHARNVLGQSSEEQLQFAQNIKRARDIYLRLGLTRPWTNPDGIEGCWLQVTGIHAFPDYSAGKKLTSLFAGALHSANEAIK